MKRWWLTVAVLVGLYASPTVAADLRFSSFNSDITVNPDASISVVETLVADFASPLHGVYRTLPYRFETLSGERASIPISIEEVRQDGAPAKYSVTEDGTNLVVKIGDANRTVEGRHVYVVRYRAQVAANFFADHDELYWNVTGTAWDAPLDDITATVHLPTSYTEASVTTACYTGAYGSTDKNCSQTHTPDSATFSSQEFLTIVVGWPTGALVKPSNYDELRTAGAQVATTPNPAFQRPSLVSLASNIVVVLLVVGWLWRRWLTHGRDPAQRKTVIAQYDPPDDLRPAELYTIMREESPMKLLLPATIVDLAVRGYLHIREVSKEKLFGLTQEKDYELELVRQADETLRTFERTILGVLFDPKFVTSASSPAIRLSGLKKRKYTANPFSPAMRELMEGVVREGYFTGNPMTAKIIVGVIGAVLLGVSFFLIGSDVFAWGGVVAGLITLGFIPAMPQRSLRGAEAAWVGHGFRLFIEKAEQYRIKWQERENIFERFLPYAMTFRLADKWSRALADVAHQPEWYSGSSDHAFSSLVFVSAMNSFASAASATVVSSAASGSSGFGGGGFSGGGGGGGGGGGW